MYYAPQLGQYYVGKVGQCNEHLQKSQLMLPVTSLKPTSLEPHGHIVACTHICVYMQVLFSLLITALCCLHWHIQFVCCTFHQRLEQGSSASCITTLHASSIVYCDHQGKVHRRRTSTNLTQWGFLASAICIKVSKWDRIRQANMQAYQCTLVFIAWYGVAITLVVSHVHRIWVLW